MVHILIFPDEIFIMIFSGLPAKDIITLSKVCQRFLRITKDKYIWGYEKLRKFGHSGLLCYQEFLPSHIFLNCMVILNNYHMRKFYCDIFDFFTDDNCVDRMIFLLTLKHPYRLTETYNKEVPEELIASAPRYYNEEVTFNHCNGYIRTTIGQLNYFKWIIENNLDEKIGNSI